MATSTEGLEESDGLDDLLREVSHEAIEMRSRVKKAQDNIGGSLKAPPTDTPLLNIGDR